jgi:hypothetical protein
MAILCRVFFTAVFLTLFACKHLENKEVFESAKNDLPEDSKNLFETPTGGDTLPSSSEITNYLDKNLSSPVSENCLTPEIPKATIVPEEIVETSDLAEVSDSKDNAKEKSDYIDLPVGAGLVDHINKFFRDQFGDYKGGEVTLGSSNDNAFHGILEKFKLIKGGDDQGKTFGLFIEHVRNYEKDEKESQLAIKFYSDLYTKLARVKDGPYSKYVGRDSTGAYYQTAKSVEGVDLDIVKGLDGSSYLRLKVGVGVEQHSSRGYGAQIQEAYHDLFNSRQYNNQESDTDKAFANTRLGYGRIIRWTNKPEGPLTKIEGGANLDTIKDQNYAYVRVINEVPVGKRVKLVTDTTVRSNKHVTVGGKIQLQATKDFSIYTGIEREIGDKRINDGKGAENVYTLGATYTFGGVEDKIKMKYRDPKKYLIIEEKVLRAKKPVLLSKDRQNKTVHYEINVYICELQSKKIVEVIPKASKSSSEMPVSFEHEDSSLLPKDSGLNITKKTCL